MTELETMTLRVNRLTRSCRRLWIALVAVVLAFGLLIAGLVRSAGESLWSRKVYAKQLMLLTPHLSSGAWASLYIDDRSNSAVLNMGNVGGPPAILLNTEATGGGSIELLDAKGKTRVRIAVGPDGEPSIATFDAGGRRLFAAAAAAARSDAGAVTMAGQH
jgi:hypothetical protein